MAMSTMGVAAAPPQPISKISPKVDFRSKSLPQQATPPTHHFLKSLWLGTLLIEAPPPLLAAAQ
ncbi:hypothetical protein [Nostoc sp. JL33]|uniref:hypothetical protein n=1 Tax=Nostoc sp. JL33 TaxID=2815396 RepID=UPI0025ED9187|nr:hypothetical protein [Nostoc sp. JL33]MBN3871094.1 hypothetical protein [Nostoc sp. JL33]